MEAWERENALYKSEDTNPTKLTHRRNEEKDKTIWKIKREKQIKPKKKG